MVPNVFIIYIKKKTHTVLAIKGEKKDETREEEGRRRGRGEKVTREERKKQKTKGEGNVRKRKQREEKLKKLKRRTRGGRKRTG
jgi:hypothetical protein